MLRSWMIVLAALAMLGHAAHAQPLADQNFEATRIFGKTVKYEQSPSLAFGTDGRITGRGGCNNYSAVYSTKSELRRVKPISRSKRPAKVRTARIWTIQVRDISSTRMFCGPGSAVESRFFGALRSARRYVLRDGSLTLYGARGRTPLMTLTKVAM